MPKCIHSNCSKFATFGSVGKQKKEYCSPHAPVGYKNLDYKLCKQEGCTTGASFGLIGSNEKEYCLLHAPLNFERVRSGTCKSSGCNTTASFGIANGTSREYCSNHKPEHYVRLSKTCIEESCTAMAYYKAKEGGSFKYCIEHRPNEYIAGGKSCEIEHCKRIALFSDAGTQPRFCGEHRHLGNVNIRSHYCQEFGCGSLAIFGPTRSEMIRCLNHKLNDDVEKPGARKRCDAENCNTSPSFGSTGGYVRRCKIHKADTDILLRGPQRCCKCNQKATFGANGGKPQWCGGHKEPGAIDLIHASCKICHKTACYGYPGCGNTYCAQHKITGTVYLPNKRCITKYCRKRAEYGVTKHEHCELHKNASEINLVNRRCSACGLMGALNRNEQCETCRPEIYEKKTLHKQKIVITYLKDQDLQPTSEDRILDNGICGKERPDLFFANDDQPHTVIVEIDEDQHKYYECARVCKCGGQNCNCDITRMKNIQQGQGGRPGYFIRFNPDIFKGSKEETKISDIERLKSLEKWIRHLLVTPPTAFLQVIYLFYDGYKKESTQIETLVDWHRDEENSADAC